MKGVYGASLRCPHGRMLLQRVDGDLAAPVVPDEGAGVNGRCVCRRRLGVSWTHILQERPLRANGNFPFRGQMKRRHTIQGLPENGRPRLGSVPGLYLAARVLAVELIPGGGDLAARDTPELMTNANLWEPEDGK